MIVDTGHLGLHTDHAVCLVSKEFKSEPGTVKVALPDKDHARVLQVSLNPVTAQRKVTCSLEIGVNAVSLAVKVLILELLIHNADNRTKLRPNLVRCQFVAGN